MANPSRRIGTEGENYALGKVRRYWPRADRAKAGNPGNDLYGLPVPIEIRRRARWDVPGWSRAQQDKHGDRWGLWLIARDRRRADAPPNLIAFPEDFALQLLYVWQQALGLDAPGEG